MLKHLARIATEILHANPWWSYRHDRYELPNGSEGEYFYIHTNGSVIVIPELPDGKLVLLNQYRYLNQRESLEFVGGGLKDGYTHEQTAREELEEEGGFHAKELIPLGTFNPMNGGTDELCQVFLARGLHEVLAKPEPSEEFERRDVTLEELRGLVSENAIWDGATLAAFLFYERHLQNLS